MFDRFLPVMSPEELHRFEAVLSGKEFPDFTDEDVARWELCLPSVSSRLMLVSMMQSLNP